MCNKYFCRCFENAYYNEIRRENARKHLDVPYGFRPDRPKTPTSSKELTDDEWAEKVRKECEEILKGRR